MDASGGVLEKNMGSVEGTGCIFETVGSQKSEFRVDCQSRERKWKSWLKPFFLRLIASAVKISL